MGSGKPTQEPTKMTIFDEISAAKRECVRITGRWPNYIFMSGIKFQELVRDHTHIRDMEVGPKRAIVSNMSVIVTNDMENMFACYSEVVL